MGKLVLSAPLSGWLTPLDQVPDPAFAGRMVGDGAAIDPVDAILRAPCDGVISMIAKARHALTLRAESGAEILLHVGIDTVALDGDGLVVRVEQGARVRRGDPLVDIDLDRVARRARSLITPVVVTDARQFPVTVGKSNCLIGAGEPFLEIGQADGAAIAASARPATSAIPDATGETVVRLEHGFHARPAARIARASRKYRSRVVLTAHGRQADAGSTVGLMALGVGFGDRVELRAFGADAASVVRALIEEIGAGLGEAPVRVPIEDMGPGPGEAPVRMREPARPTPGAATAAATVREIRGAVASRGLAIGVARQYVEPRIEVAEAGAGVELELETLVAALAAVKTRLEAMAAIGNDILGAQCEFLDDPGLLDDARAAVRAGKSAGQAWRNAIGKAQDLFRQTGVARLTERVADLADVERQVLQALAKATDAAPIELPEAAIVLAAELLPSQLARLDPAKVAGLCSAAGGPTSHVALLAASMGIPALVGAGASVLSIPDGTRLLLDADAGRLVIEPDEEETARTRGRMADRRSRRARDLLDARPDCYTQDGCRIEVFANLGSLADASHAVECGAEGCGLLRTEFLFRNRTAAPTAAEQAAEYKAIAEALSPRPLVIRLLDAGGDKPIPFLPLPREENPLLGLRGLRATLRFPELLRDQLAAIIEVHAGLPAESAAARCRILLPMITEPEEIRAVRRIIDELAGETESGDRIAVGAMIETPASAILARAIAAEADFLSIGSNDLAQYTLAMDRAHPLLAAAFDYFHPAVLQQIAAVCEAAGRQGRGVSVCGALASDPQAAPVLIGLGVRTLSAVPGVIPELKGVVRALSLAACRERARRALEENSAAGLRKALEVFPGPASRP
jgi:multiphosphoryl transfer protein